MGLAFRECDARWSYSGFNDFRKKLARATGDESCLAYADAIERDRKLWDQGEYVQTTALVNVTHPLKDLLMHSDCDGELTWEQCEALAPEIEKIVTEWPEHDYDRIQALELVRGMRQAVKDKGQITFA